MDVPIPFASLSAAAVLLLVACGLAPASQEAADRPLDLVDTVDLERYQGRWYEIARLPNSFQEQCAGEVTAEYSLEEEEGRLRVVNRCRTRDGGFDRAVGVARRPDPDRPAALEVRFAPAWLAWLPFVWGDYQILALDADYRWAMVGAPSREYLWILAREPRLDERRVRSLLALAERQGFPVDEVTRTRQGRP